VSALIDERALRALIVDVVREELAKMQAPAEYLSTGEAAKLAGVAAGTVRRWIREARLTEHRAGRHVRVRRADLERLLGGSRKTPDLSPEELARRVFGRAGDSG
jgi:excisionase family DNA binding protein